MIDGDVANDLNFGNRFVTPGEIHGTKWNDENGDGIFDAGESGLLGVFIQLFKLTPPDVIGSWFAQQTTSSDGTYAFTDIPPGFYRLAEVVPSSQLSEFAQLLQNISKQISKVEENVSKLTNNMSRIEHEQAARMADVERELADLPAVPMDSFDEDEEHADLGE